MLGNQSWIQEGSEAGTEQHREEARSGSATTWRAKMLTKGRMGQTGVRGGSRQTGHPGSETRQMGPVGMWVPYTKERFGFLGLRGEEWSGQTAKVQRHWPDSEVGELHLKVER